MSVTDQTPLEALEPPRFERSYVLGPDYPSRAASAFIRYTWSKPKNVLRYLLPPVVLIVVFTIANILQGLPFLPVEIGFLLVVVIIYSLLALSITWRMRRSIRKSIVPGAEIQVGFRDDVMVIRGPLGSSETKYAAFSEVIERADSVFLKSRLTKRYSLFPIELFSRESISFLKSKVTP